MTEIHDDIESHYMPEVATLRRKFNHGYSGSPQERGMYSVPENLHRSNEKAYIPRAISIGPLHDGKSSGYLQEKKFAYLEVFLKWAKSDMNQLIQFVKDREKRIKSYYTVDTTDRYLGDKFIELILVDSAFVVVLMMKCCWDKLRDENDTIIFEGYMQLEILRDLILLENQVPLFVLKDLYDELKKAEHMEFSFFKIALSFFWAVNLQKTEDTPSHIEIKSPDGEEVKHFVDMLSIYNRPPLLKHPQASNVSTVYFRSLTELYDAEVKIRRSTSKHLLEIKYHRGILEIPHIRNLTENIGTFLGNLVAFEQCHCRSDKYTTDYVCLMARFLTCPRDVKLLNQHGILDSWLGDNQQVCNVFINLSKETLFHVESFHYKHLCEQLDSYCEVPRHKWRAALRHDYLVNPWRIIHTLRHDYLVNPWRIIHTFVAVIFVVATVMNTAVTFYINFGRKR